MYPGIILVLATVFAALQEWTDLRFAPLVAGFFIGLYLLWAMPRVAWSRLAFLAVGGVLAVATFATQPDWQAILLEGVRQGSFIGAFFVALATLRTPALHSIAIQRCGRYIATQPPGRRYLALSTGGHLFALVLNYGSIQLLAAMTESMRQGNGVDPAIARIRNKRMLLAIQRGFIASIFWSPLGFAMILTVSYVPGTSWGSVAPFALLNMLLFTLVGWALDTFFKPSLSGTVQRPKIEGSPRALLAIVLLLTIILGGVGILELITRLRVAAIVIVFVPIVAFCWLLIERQLGEGPPLRTTLRRLIGEELPNYRSELVLLVMAGFIGSVGGELLQPLMERFGVDLSSVPAVPLLIAIMAFVPFLGQIGMNPILGVTLFAPLLPSPEALGVAPQLIVLAVVSGWAITALTSPFTATTLLIGRYGGVSAWTAGFVWNAPLVISLFVLFSLVLAGLDIVLPI